MGVMTNNTRFLFLMNLWSNYLSTLVRCQGYVQNESQCAVIYKRITTVHTLIHFCQSVEHLHILLGFLGDSKLS